MTYAENFPETQLIAMHYRKKYLDAHVGTTIS